MEKLHLKEYWSGTDPQDWALTDYFMALIKKNPESDKRSSHQKLDSDLNHLYVVYIDDHATKKKISSLQHSLKRPSRAISTTLNQFWDNHSQALREASLASKVTDKKLESALSSKAKKLITNEIENVELATHSHSQKRQAPKGESSNSKRREVLPEDNEHDKEIDGVYIGNHEYSVGTTIKRAAIDLHKKLQQGAAMTPRQLKVMTSGLSSILDLSDDSFASQISLFSSTDWSILKEHFAEVLKLSPIKLNDKIKDNLIITYNTLALSNDIRCCIRLIRQEAELAIGETSRAGLFIMKKYLQAMHRYPHMLTKPYTKKVTEADFFRCIWSPIFEALFPPQDQQVRIKCGESINSYTTEKKKANYVDNKSVKGFKIDFRFLVDQCDGTETDIGVGECALEDEDSKAISDEGKLTREGKDSLDEVIKIVPEDIGSSTIWIVQIAGAHCSLSTLHLQSSGLYIVMHRHSFNLPYSEKCLEKCEESIQWLLKMREHLLELNRFVTKHSSIKSCNDITFNRRQNQPINSKFSFMRDTYYTPPRDAPSKLPSFMFGSPPVYDQGASQITSTTTIEPSSNDPENGLTFEGEADVYGFRRLDDGQYFNIFSKKISASHPLQIIPPPF